MQFYALWGRMGLFRIDNECQTLMIIQYSYLINSHELIAIGGTEGGHRNLSEYRFVSADITGHFRNKIPKFYCSVYLPR